MSKPNRLKPRNLMCELTEIEHAAIHKIAAERGVTIRDLVVSSILDSEPSDILQRVLQLEVRLRLLEGDVVR